MSTTTPRRRRVFTHLTAAVVVPGCGVLCWWQVTRALSGNTLSWAYVFEWPIFGGYAVYMWWKLIHDPLPEDRPEKLEEKEQEKENREKEDEELASYNRYLAALNDSGKRKHW